MRESLCLYCLFALADTLHLEAAAAATAGANRDVIGGRVELGACVPGGSAKAETDCSTVIPCSQQRTQEPERGQTEGLGEKSCGL